MQNFTDQLTSYNGNTITYDSIGNPLNYCNLSSYTFEWAGRQLTSVTRGGGSTISMAYDSEGYRISKTSRNSTVEYVYLDGVLIAEKTSTYMIVYTFDENGSPTGFKYRLNTDEAGAWQVFVYEKNIFGDVVAVYTGAGSKQVSYTYDAWGNFISNYHNGATSSSPAAKNPFRYRGYYYDSDLNLYYLGSRYYDSNTGRFINADSYVSTGQGLTGYNMYAYCLNNPINRLDLDGRCSRFLGFLWKIDCKQASCPESRNYIKPKEIAPIGSYNNGQGYVYVVTQDQLHIMEDREENALVIVDQRSSSDPNMKMLGSYRIRNSIQQKEIAQLMIDYNLANPVNPEWSRSLDSLVEEWKLHNFAYMFFINRGSTADCDFNNAAEGMGFWDFVEMTVW